MILRFLYQNHHIVFRRHLYVYSILAVNALFIVSPQVDLITSRYFFRHGDFSASNSPAWVALRDFHRVSQWWLLVGMLVLIAFYALWRRPIRSIAPHKVLYVLLTFALGPGIVTQSLKLLIGRARPRHLLKFGGSMDFTPAWQMAATCSKNCSFPSGEGAAAAAMLSLLIFVPERWRVVSAAIFIPILMLISMNRVFMGAHFLSDVVIAWSLVAGVMLWLWPRINAKAETIDRWVRRKGQFLRPRAD